MCFLASIFLCHQIPLFQQHPHLKQFVRPAIERAVQELVHPVVERSIKICLTTAEMIVKKVGFGVQWTVLFEFSILLQTTSSSPFRRSLSCDSRKITDSPPFPPPPLSLLEGTPAAHQHHFIISRFIFSDSREELRRKGGNARGLILQQVSASSW